jgi:hypothetical protein
MVSVAQKFYRGLMASLPDRLAVQAQYYRVHKKFANIDHPETFTEKIQARKLSPYPEIYAELCDKVTVKDFVKRTVGEDVVIPTIWAGTELPASRPEAWPLPFVVKSNHTSGWNIFVREDNVDWGEVRTQANAWVHKPWQPHIREGWYNQMKRQILVEPLIGNPNESLNDYKFFVFGGRTEYIQVDTDRFSAHQRAFYDRNWIRQPFGFLYPVEDKDVPKPMHFDRMLEIAEKLGADFDFVRVDLYDLPEGPKFGEMTFAPESGYGRFTPSSYDLELGRLWRSR